MRFSFWWHGEGCGGGGGDGSDDDDVRVEIPIGLEIFFGLAKGALYAYVGRKGTLYLL